MHRCEAIKRQVLSKPEKTLQVNNFSFISIAWVTTLFIGSFIGAILSYVYEKDTRKIIQELGLSPLTGPRAYIDALWMYVWIIKLISLLVVFLKTNEWNLYKRSIASDVCLTILFFIEYSVVLMIYEQTEFKLSGHGLLLTMCTSFMQMEGELNAALTHRKEVKMLCSTVVVLNFYIFFWTALGYHPLLEALSGSLLGLFSSYLVYSSFNR